MRPICWLPQYERWDWLSHFCGASFDLLWNPHRTIVAPLTCSDDDAFCAHLPLQIPEDSFQWSALPLSYHSCIDARFCFDLFVLWEAHKSQLWLPTVAFGLSNNATYLVSTFVRKLAMLMMRQCSFPPHSVEVFWTIHKGEDDFNQDPSQRYRLDGTICCKFLSFVSITNLSVFC